MYQHQFLVITAGLQAWSAISAYNCNDYFWSGIRPTSLRDVLENELRACNYWTDLTDASFNLPAITEWNSREQLISWLGSTKFQSFEYLLITPKRMGRLRELSEHTLKWFGKCCKVKQINGLCGLDMLYGQIELWWKRIQGTCLITCYMGSIHSSCLMLPILPSMFWIGPKSQILLNC